MLKHIIIHTLSQRKWSFSRFLWKALLSSRWKMDHFTVCFTSLFTQTSFISQTFLECTTTDSSCLHIYLQALVRRGENSHVWENKEEKTKTLYKQQHRNSFIRSLAQKKFVYKLQQRVEKSFSKVFPKKKGRKGGLLNATRANKHVFASRTVQKAELGPASTRNIPQSSPRRRARVSARHKKLYAHQGTIETNSGNTV